MKILWLLLFSSAALGQEIDLDNQLLWEISGKGMKTKSYLYGSFHTNDKRVFRWGDSTYTALLKADAIVLETDIYELFEEWDTRKDEVRFNYDEQGNPYTPNRNASRTMYGNEDGMPQFLDAYLMQFCYNSGKQFFGLEEVEDQLGLLDGTVDYIPEYRSIESMMISQERILRLYLKGDINELDRAMRTSLAIYPDVYNELIVDRNYKMAAGIDTLMREGTLFVAVGAGHLGGDQGVVSLLRSKGYRLRKIQCTYSENPTEARKKFLSYKNYQYTDEEVGLNAVFPGKPLVVRDGEKTSHKKLIYREMGQGNTYIVELIRKEEGADLESVAAEYIQTPDNSTIQFDVLDDGTMYAQGLSDAYPEGVSWMRIIEGTDHMVIMKSYGGNKFMNSNRPTAFFNRVWFDQ